jgi:SAM-dependent methyltransferase
VSDGDRTKAWADFWRKERACGGCLADAGSELAAVQSKIWQGFAEHLPKKARVLDLGTGDGIVLKLMAERRKDIRLTGVDSAPFLPAARGRMRLQAGVAMEQLPFVPASFDGVVSQFGYEYGDTRQAAGEVRRVLAAGGRFLFLVHRGDGPVVAHNRRRGEALDWILGNGLLDRARSLAAARQTVLLPTPPSFAEVVRNAGARFGPSSVAAEIAEAVRQSLRPGFGAQESLAAIDEIERKGRSELVRLKALAAAARDESSAAAMIEELRIAGLQPDALTALASRSGEPFAWVLAGRG